MTPDLLIESLGGTSVVARSLRVALPTVSNWRSRASIPAQWWPGLITLASERGISGITLELLAEMHARPSTESETVALDEVRP